MMRGPFLVVSPTATPTGIDEEPDEHINEKLHTSLLAIPGFTRVMRLRLVKGGGPSRVVISLAERWETSVASAYDAVARSSIANAPTIVGQPAVYKETTRIHQGQVERERRGYLLLVRMDVPPEFENEFNDWYEREHIPMLMQIPGWVDAMRYTRVEGDVPKHMTIYELEGPWALDRPEHEMTHRTEWYRRVRPHFENFSSLLYELVSELQKQ
jgi:hypothetical protein